VLDGDGSAVALRDFLPHLVDLQSTIDHIGLGVAGLRTQPLHGLRRVGGEVDRDPHQSAAATTGAAATIGSVDSIKGNAVAYTAVFVTALVVGVWGNKRLK
jgi:hypothetical protein